MSDFYEDYFDDFYDDFYGHSSGVAFTLTISFSDGTEESAESSDFVATFTESAAFTVV